MPVAGQLVAGAASAAVGSLLNKGSQQAGTTTTTANPWAGAQPYLNSGLQRAEGIYTNQPQQIGQAQQMQTQRAISGSPLDAAAQQNNLQTLQGNFLSPDSNPYLKGAVNTAMGDVRGQINSQFQGDNYGNSAHQEWLGKGLMNAAAPIYAQNYQQERQRQLGAQALAPTLAGQDYANIAQLYQAGNIPMDQLQRYMQMAQGAGGLGGTSSSPYYTNPAAGALGGAVGGLGLYNSLGGSGLFGNSSQGSAVGSSGMSSTPYFGSFGWGNT